MGYLALFSPILGYMGLDMGLYTAIQGYIPVYGLYPGYTVYGPVYRDIPLYRPVSRPVHRAI